MSAGDLRSPEAVARNRESSRLAKQRRRGECVECGAETRYNGHGGRNGPSLRCSSCSHVHVGELLQGSGRNQRRLHELLEAGVSSRPDLIAAGAAPNGATFNVLVNREIKAGRVVRIGRGLYARGEVVDSTPGKKRARRRST